MSTLPHKEIERIYLALGRALWHLQYVEDALNALITIKQDIGGPGRFTDAEARAMLTEQLKATMGQAVRRAEKCALLPAEDLRRLAYLKDERNWVAHKVQRTVGDSVLSPWGRLELLQRLEHITTESQVLLKVVASEMQRFVGSTGHELVVSARLTALLAADRASAA